MNWVSEWLGFYDPFCNWGYIESMWWWWWTTLPPGHNALLFSKSDKGSFTCIMGRDHTTRHCRYLCLGSLISQLWGTGWEEVSCAWVLVSGLCHSTSVRQHYICYMPHPDTSEIILTNWLNILYISHCKMMVHTCVCGYSGKCIECSKTGYEVKNYIVRYVHFKITGRIAGTVFFQTDYFIGRNNNHSTYSTMIRVRPCFLELRREWGTRR